MFANLDLGHEFLITIKTCGAGYLNMLSMILASYKRKPLLYLAWVA